jgi:hypothetical protein
MKQTLNARRPTVRYFAKNSHEAPSSCPAEIAVVGALSGDSRVATVRFPLLALLLVSSHESSRDNSPAEKRFPTLLSSAALLFSTNISLYPFQGPNVNIQ